MSASAVNSSSSTSHRRRVDRVAVAGEHVLDLQAVRDLLQRQHVSPSGGRWSATPGSWRCPRRRRTAAARPSSRCERLLAAEQPGRVEVVGRARSTRTRSRGPAASPSVSVAGRPRPARSPAGCGCSAADDGVWTTCQPWKNSSSVSRSGLGNQVRCVSRSVRSDDRLGHRLGDQVGVDGHRARPAPARRRRCRPRPARGRRARSPRPISSGASGGRPPCRRHLADAEAVQLERPRAPASQTSKSSFSISAPTPP